MGKTMYIEEKKNELIEALTQGVVTVSFTKVDGSRRDMQCTLNQAHLPVVESVGKPASRRKYNPDVQSVYDVNAKGWRSWRWDSVIEFTNQ
jgi:hypothetical protein